MRGAIKKESSLPGSAARSVGAELQFFGVAHTYRKNGAESNKSDDWGKRQIGCLFPAGSDKFPPGASLPTRGRGKEDDEGQGEKRRGEGSRERHARETRGRGGGAGGILDDHP